MIKRLDVVDFHAHILPCADHGSDSLETTLWQLKSAKSQGVTRIISTPHFYPHRHTVEAFVTRRDEAYSTLMRHIPDGVEVIRGAEVLICQAIECLPGIENLLIEGTNTLLLELPFSNFDEAFCDSVEEMSQNGINVVIAHADRYPKNNVDKMIRSGARLQINASALSGIFCRKEILSWIDRGVVVAIGSDIHERDRRAYRKFRKAIKRVGKSATFIKEQSDIIWNQANRKK